MLSQELRERLSHARASLLTAFGVRKQGRFAPYPYADLAERAICRLRRADAWCSNRADDATFSTCLNALGRASPRSERFGDVVEDSCLGKAQCLSPRDGVIAYEMVRRHRPRRILEIGSGNSTRFLVRAVRDEGLDCEITCIDPQPRSEIAELQVLHAPRALRIGGPSRWCRSSTPATCCSSTPATSCCREWTSTSSSTSSSRTQTGRHRPRSRHIPAVRLPQGLERAPAILGTERALWLDLLGLLRAAVRRALRLARAWRTPGRASRPSLHHSAIRRGQHLAAAALTA